jgi:hypothetical protein
MELGVGAAEARDEFAGFGGDDGHGVGIAEGVGPAAARDFVFEEGEHESGRPVIVAAKGGKQ